MSASDLEIIRLQESELAFPEFSELTAFAIGTMIQHRAVAQGWPVVIDIRLWDRPLFFAALPGATASNGEWVRRKAFAVRAFGKSSYRVLLERNRERLLPPDHGLDPRDYALHGGSFPIRAAGFGVIGAATVSGLDERRDHMVVVEAFAGHLGKDATPLTLPPE